ncbi:MAG: glycogen phosphorylase, partial [gamma proteobacterium symbiont of Ctena orbiculata]
TMGTMDGANVEMQENIGADNIFIFGLTTEDITRLNRQGYQPRRYYDSDPVLKRIIDMIANGFFSPEEPARYRMITDNLLNKDHFKVIADFKSYLEVSDRADQLYLNTAEWNRRAILNTARMGYFSSDRTIQEYAEKIWHVKPIR